MPQTEHSDRDSNEIGQGYQLVTTISIWSARSLSVSSKASEPYTNSDPSYRIKLKYPPRSIKKNKTIKPIRWTPTPMHLPIKPGKISSQLAKIPRAWLAGKKKSVENITIPILKYKLNSRKKIPPLPPITARRHPSRESTRAVRSGRSISRLRSSRHYWFISIHSKLFFFFLFHLLGSSICYRLGYNNTTEFGSHFRAHRFFLFVPLWFSQTCRFVPTFFADEWWLQWVSKFEGLGYV